jgi:hypothetical protein
MIRNTERTHEREVGATIHANLRWEWQSRGRRALLTAAAIVLAYLGVSPSLAADISYVYDDAGRLRAVIDPASDTAYLLILRPAARPDHQTNITECRILHRIYSLHSESSEERRCIVQDLTPLFCPIHYLDAVSVAVLA